MVNSASPPRPPLLQTDRETSRGVRISMILHVVAAIVFIVYTRVRPPQPFTNFVPTLRVDLVGLPDALKKDLALPVEPAPQTALPAEKAQSKAPPKEVAKPDEMVLKGKKKPEPTQARESAMKNALKRMKALAKVSDEQPAVVIKGNKVSPGSSLEGNAKEGEATYLDRLRARLQDNWALPIWLSRQNLTAKVQVQIDAIGRMSGFTFVQRSGNAQFDESVIRTLRDSVPFPRPPGALSVLVGFPL